MPESPEEDSRSSTWEEEHRAENEADARHVERNRRFRERFNGGTPSDAVVAELTRGDRGSNIGNILLDDSTFRHALLFAGCEESNSFDRVELTENRELAFHAITSLVEALVLHDRVVIGADLELATVPVGGMFGLGIDVFRSLPPTTENARFWLLSAARRMSFEAVTEIPELAEIMTTSIGEEVTTAGIAANLERITVRGSEQSIHKILHLIENDSFYLDGMAGRLEDDLDWHTLGLRGADVVEEADNAINLNLGRFHSVPRDGVGEFFAAHALLRAIYYLLIADYRGLSYHGDHVRAGTVRALLAGERRRSFAETIVREIEATEARRDEAVNAALRFEAFPVALPLVANAILQRARSRRECIAIALEVRASRQAIQFRQYCKVVDRAILDGDRRRIERSIAELQRYGVRLSDSIGVGPAGSEQAAVKELVTYASPLAGAMLSVFRAPLQEVVNRVRDRKFALLTELRASQRGAVARRRFDDLWASLPPSPPGWPRGRDFRKRRGW
ncbi:hypothetical protein ACQPZX_16785 [Actinoplanes sp. CA-142083]|uniref:hypothetical protein n=1 Tax=Actinoplanes sp. CA-142083 TaxID=3239903 RepID=UPI003D906715